MILGPAILADCRAGNPTPNMQFIFGNRYRAPAVSASLRSGAVSTAIVNAFQAFGLECSAFSI